eukprot:CAMPEP_0115601226 /NCGR_PEP_ID=MMETSP0272-20121206/15292_1 /TAXON_ID=71861 /ORGANISM="Scrippsiella trochoidea, Strain CCMP3099" /LENGTH=175 /DNA_ID=CAMNT_0003036689 /DNA_START=1845 /DNA_END=2373 /DNA_ORIENTATION=+
MTPRTHIPLWVCRRRAAGERLDWYHGSPPHSIPRVPGYLSTQILVSRKAPSNGSRGNTNDEHDDHKPKAALTTKVHPGVHHIFVTSNVVADHEESSRLKSWLACTSDSALSTDASATTRGANRGEDQWNREDARGRFFSRPCAALNPRAEHDDAEPSEHSAKPSGASRATSRASL